ncbi:MAG TPA: hypothetical protein VFH31_05120, partial [Pyrinomonadaceae bacterium]|nr:hypothetical protein [Pyrinomonadaceae bacterium]
LTVRSGIMKRTKTSGLAVAICLTVLGTACNFSRQLLSSSVSPNHRYRVEVLQNRDFAQVERRVYLNAYRKAEQFVRDKLIFTGDLLDDDFRNLYPNYHWISESILKIGRNPAETQTNRLTVTNESSSRISYLLIETYRDKYVLFDVEPKSVTGIQFQFLGQLSCQGEFVGTEQKFGSAVRLANDSEREVQGAFSISVINTGALIESKELKLKQVTCCAVDRPDINHESY